MSSRTDAPLKAGTAGQRMTLAGMAGLAARAAIVALIGVFVWQAGVLAPPAPQDVRSNDVVEKPDQIIATNARITGRDRNDRPFEISAKTGEQDKAVDSLVHMSTVTSVFERPTGARLDVTSQGGQFDRKTKALELSGNVVFREGERFRAVMDKAAIDIENQSLASKSPVKVDMRGTTIEADSLKVTDNGTRILFRGRVKASFRQSDKTTGDGEQ